MNLHVGQLVALACHFNGRARKASDIGLSSEHPTCTGCESVRFFRGRRVLLGLATRWEPVAEDINEWLADQIDPNTAACLVHESTEDPVSERLSVGEVKGGGRWLLALAGASTMCRWEAEWKSAHRDAPAGKRWRVSYYLVDEDVRAELPRLAPIKDLFVALRRVLMDLYYLAQQHGVEEYAERFARAESCLSAEDPLGLIGRRDLSPAGVLYRPAERLLACCQTAWVFGAGESWGQLVFDGATQVQHQRWTDQLYSLVNEAICAAVNSVAGGAA